MDQKLKVGILGGTGMVGQRFISLLENHPWFEVVAIAASPRSAGKTYEEAVGGRWKMQKAMPEAVKNIVVMNVNEVEKVASEVDFVFSAVDMSKEEIRAIEDAYAKTETPVVSNNSAHRWTPDVPMVVPEINPEHFEVIEAQKKRLGTKKGFVAVKPNCSIQSYAPALFALKEFGPKEVVATTYQAISGAGKTFKDWPEMVENIIPFIGGEEEKSEQEPLRLFGKVVDGKIEKATAPLITTQCIRVPVLDGHTAAVFVNFEKKPTKEEIIDRWENFKGLPQELNLPSAPKQFIRYMEDGPYKEQEIRQAYLKAVYLLLDTVREIDGDAYSQLQNADLLSKCTEAVTLREMEQNYRDGMALVCSPRRMKEDISNYTIKRAINYIREHYKEGISLEDVAGRMGITPEYLSTLFNREMGENFSTFLRKFRISHAKRLLKGTDMKVYEIAEAVGYTDPKYFARVFKDELGVSPGDYRQQ